jgi:hypothetical protein
MLNSNLDKLILQLNKVKKKLKVVEAITPEQSALRPYEIDAQVLELKKILDTPPLFELLRETILYKELKDFCEQEQQKINKYKEEFHFSLGTKLRDLFVSLGELKGQLPILRVKFYTVQFDFTNGETTIWWGPEKEIIKKVNLEPITIAQTIKSFDENMSTTWKRPEDFVNILKSAYNRYIKLNNLDLSEKVNLLDLLTECVILMQGKSFKTDPTKTHFTEYSRIQYSYDLYKTKTSSSLISNMQLSVATFAVTESREKSLWVPDNEIGDGTYYQSIAFKQP